MMTARIAFAIRSFLKPSRISRSLVSILVLTLLQFGLSFQQIPAASATSFGSSACTSDFSNTANLTEVTLANFCIVKITSGTTTWTPPLGVQSLYVLAVGGGGGGGNNVGGGGGGGAVAYGQYTVGATTNVSISVGTGGAGGSSAAGNSVSSPAMDGQVGGSSTVLANSGVMSLTAAGGNGGETHWDSNICASGNPAAPSTVTGGAVSSSGAYAGITNSSGATGGAHNANGVNGGAGGSGSSRSITGSAVFYGAGGGGGAWGATGGGGGTGGGGAGGGTSVAGSAGTANTGSGGGGGGNGCAAGGAGGSGIVILRWVPVPVVAAPANSTSLVNRSAIFSTTVTTSTTLTKTYQWGVSTNSGTTYSTVFDGSGATTLTFTTAVNTNAQNGNLYRVGTTFSDGTISSIGYSAGATLTVTTPPGSDTDTALYFNGSTYVKVADSNEVDFANNFTFEAWVKPEVMSGYGMILNKEDSVEFYINGGYFGIAAQSTLGKWGYFQTGVPATVGEWQHIAYTRVANSTSVNVYFNGSLGWSGVIDADFTGTPLNTSYPLMFGGRSTSGDGTTMVPSFKGLIDQVAVFSSVRTQSEIQNDLNGYISPSTAGLQLYYDFNEGTSSTTLYNRKSGSTTASDMTLSPTPPTWTDVKEVSYPANSPYTVIKFARTYITSTGGWRVPTNAKNASVLVVGGGGGGGGQGYLTDPGGGGGGGGVYEIGTYPLSPGDSVSVIVGAGGFGGRPVTPNQKSIGRIGGSTTFGQMVAGGGGGATYDSGDITINASAGLAGGGGGGASYYWNATTYGAGGAGSSLTIGGVTYPGRTGGNASGYSGSTAGGGGGASGETSGPNSGIASASKPGAGVTSSITGETYGRGGLGGGGSAYTFSSPAALPGNGGDGYSSSTANGGHGVNGANGLVVVRFITAVLPSYTKPTNAYLNVGMTETFTTNVAQDSATAVLTRTFKWESTTPSANGAYTLIKQGTGAANAAFSWMPIDTSTSGSGYLYRLTVTDSDTAGLFITDSSTAYAVINRALVVSGTSSLGKTINLAKSETYTITLGTPTYTASLSPTIAGITLDTSTVGSAVIKISETMTVGTYYETLTVTDSVSASVVTPLTIVVAAPPNLVNTGEIVNNGLIFNLDFANSASFDRGTRAAKDISGSNKSVTVHNSPSFKDENLGHLDLNSSSSQYISATGFTTLTTWTIDTYFRLDSTSQYSCIVSSEGTSSTATRNLALCVDATTPRIYAGFYDGVSWTYIRTNETIPLNTWTHVAAEWDGLTSNATTSVKIWINGTQATNYQWYTRGTSAAAASSNRIFINHDPVTTVSSYTDLSIGYVRIYNRPLSFAEVTQNYNATKNRFLTANVDLATPSLKYGNTSTETYTITSGYGSDTISYATGNKSGVKLETTTSLVTLKMQESLTATTHYETITVTDSLGASTYLPITMSVTKADTITVTMGTAHTAVYAGTSPAGAPRASISGLVGVDTATVETQYSGTYIDSSLRCSEGGSCSVGDVGPGGGWIFYVSSTPINAATGVSNGGIYLEAAPRNWNGDASEEASSSFASVLTNVNGTSSAIGSGAENSRILRQELGDSATAVTKALNKTINGVDDWFVPSYEELTRMITVLIPLGLGSFEATRNLWSSTQNSNPNKANNAWSSNPPVLNELLKTDNYYLRPIRAFSPTYYSTDTPSEVDTYTAQGTNLTFQVGAASNYQAVIYDTSTLKITQANQKQLALNLYGAVAGTPFTLQISGGSGTGAVTETVTSGSTAGNCRVSNKVLSNDTPSTEQKTCNISITKASSRNYKAETLTATVYFMMYVNNQPTNQVGGGTVIALNGVTSFETSTVTPPGITGFSSLNISLSAGGSLRISGSGLTGSITVKFSRNKTVSATAADGTYIDIPVASIQSAGATSGRVAVITVNGEAVSDQSLTITP